MNELMNSINIAFLICSRFSDQKGHPPYIREKWYCSEEINTGIAVSKGDFEQNSKVNIANGQEKPPDINDF